MRIAQKVVAYIVRDERVVVFLHADDLSIDESGIQMPAGDTGPLVTALDRRGFLVVAPRHLRKGERLTLLLAD
jgi:hypothetical protein